MGPYPSYPYMDYKWGSYVAYFEGGQDRAESGRSVAEAVGALVVEQRSRLALEISLVENFLDMKRWVNPCED